MNLHTYGALMPRIASTLIQLTWFESLIYFRTYRLSRAVESALTYWRHVRALFDFFGYAPRRVSPIVLTLQRKNLSYHLEFNQSKSMA